MRALVIAPSRSAGKWVHQNIYQYFGRLGGWSFTHPFEHIPITDTTVPKELLEIPSLLENYHYLPDNIALRVHTPAFTRHPALREQLVKLVKHFDYVVQIVNTNHFERTLSRLIALHTELYQPGYEQEQAKAHLRDEKLTIPINRFLAMLDHTDLQPIALENVLTVQFKDIAKITNYVKFCTAFNLRQARFNFIEPQIEYGDKRVLITNYEELLEIYQTHRLNEQQ